MATATIVGMKYRSTKLDESQDLILKRDFDNKFDKNAVGVYQNDKLVAYVARGDTHMFKVGVFTARIYKKFPAAYDVRVISEEPLESVVGEKPLECDPVCVTSMEPLEIALFLLHHSLFNTKAEQLFGEDLLSVYSFLKNRFSAVYYHDLHTLNELENLEKFEKYKHFINVIESEITKTVKLNQLPEVEIDPEDLE